VIRPDRPCNGAAPPEPAEAPGRKRRVKAVLRKLHERNQQRLTRRRAVRAARKARQPKFSRKFHKRKAALALSVGAMGLSTAAANYQPPAPPGIQAQLDPVIRRHAALLKVSDAMKETLVEEEGARDVVYRDVAGYATVGVGHLVTPEDNLRVGDRVSEEQILDFLEEDLAAAEAAVARLVGTLPINQFEFDALVDLAYNVGEGNLSPTESPRLNAAIGARDYDGIADELSYHHAAGKIANGLVHRSERRTNIFLSGSYENPRNQV
jgi:lysozyme